jgi:subtilisin family serine protease
MVVQSAGNQSSPYPQTGYSPASYPTGVYDACEWSYGYLPGVLTVGGADQNNNRWTSYWSGDSPVGCTLPPGFDGLDKVSCGSNVGYCIDVWAPAANILSASRFDAYGYCRLSGTSMAAPHAAGVAALYLEAHPLALPAEVEAAIVAGATTGLLNTNPTTPNHIGSGSPNRLLYSFVP